MCPGGGHSLEARADDIIVTERCCVIFLTAVTVLVIRLSSRQSGRLQISIVSSVALLHPHTHTRRGATVERSVLASYKFLCFCTDLSSKFKCNKLEGCMLVGFIRNLRIMNDDALMLLVSCKPNCSSTKPIFPFHIHNFIL